MDANHYFHETDAQALRAHSRTAAACAAPTSAVTLAAQRITTFVVVLGCLLFAMGGACLAIAGQGSSERWTGVLGVFFFGGSLLAMMMEVRPRH